MSRSRHAPARAGSSAAQLGLFAAEGGEAGEISGGPRLHAKPARYWLKRFNAEGLAGLEERERPGRPPTYTAEQVGEMIVAALTNRRPGPAVRVLDAGPAGRLPGRGKGIAIKRSRIGEILSARACGGASRRPGSAGGSTPSSREKGGDREALHRPARGQRRRLPRRDGAGSRPRASRAAARRSRPDADPGGAGQAGDRLRAARARATSSGRSGRPPARRSRALRAPHDGQLGRLPGRVEAWVAGRASSGSTRSWTT